MKFITVRDFRTYPKKIWEELEKIQEMVITNNGKPIALLTPLYGSDFESTIKAVRQAKAKMSVDLMRKISVQKGNDKLSAKGLDEIIKKARKSNK